LSGRPRPEQDPEQGQQGKEQRPGHRRLEGSLLPFFAGCFLFWVGYEVVKQSGLGASAPVGVGFALGVPLVIVTRLTTKSDFFKQHPMVYGSID
jgi:hypothetical protein